MVKRYSSREARANFSDILGFVYYTKEPVIVERKGKPYAVMISPEQYDALQQEEAQTWQLIDAMRQQNAPFDPDEIEAAVTAEVEAVRERRYAEEQRAGQRRR
ncbi:MAG: type II toxin-antitoxin system Phd/YefM family antitoxin [Dehalococcoidia bacterium]